MTALAMMLAAAGIVGFVGGALRAHRLLTRGRK